MGKTVQIHIRAKVGRDDDLIAFYRAIPREYRGDVNRAMLSALRAGINKAATPQETPEIKAILESLPAKFREILDAALAGVVIGQVERGAQEDEAFGASLLDELTLD